MLFYDLALILTIMINTLMLHESSEAAIIPGKRQPNFYPQGVLKRSNYLYENEKVQRLPEKNGRRNKTIKMKQREWYLDPIMIKLDIAIDKFDERRGLIETVYSGVIECGLNKCEKFQGLIPENQAMGHVHCLRNNFKKMISTKLLMFHRGVQIIEKNFSELIYFEKMSRFNDRSRLNVLKKLHQDMIMLNLEIKTVMTNKRLNFSRQPETSTSFIIPHPDNETHLIINEWRIIQDSKRFLKDWQQNFKKIFKCWKKRRQKRRKKRL